MSFVLTLRFASIAFATELKLSAVQNSELFISASSGFLPDVGNKAAL